MTDPSDYQEKKSFFDRVLTVYGRKAVLETLQNSTLQCQALHLAQSNREAGIVAEIRQRAISLDIPVKQHSREALARISKNGKQDQGVAVDVVCPSFSKLQDYLAGPRPKSNVRLLALDGIHNPQNLGMIIRSATAGNIDGIILSRKGTAAIGPLVIKASVGTVYRAPLLFCDSLMEALQLCRKHDAEICALEASAERSLFDHRPQRLCVYILGNETEGVSTHLRELVDTPLSIPMRNGVESLNVAVAASLIAYGSYFER
jgi:23S rRNA (guanosine2251-2'-O)-methyltransferase